MDSFEDTLETQRSITVLVQIESELLVYTGIYRNMMIEYVNEHADSTQSQECPLRLL